MPGAPEEAVTVLQQQDRRNSHDLAGYLIDLGRVEDALALLQRRNPRLPKLTVGS
ncbi:hypothetical protein ACIP98_33000 [Streptomyces sp. NPDC088354]|uniref:hypothetical protein n=1 Tax=Streptomyces sp. NPDC088354 TaxID=3365856 RepID=UPI0037F7ABAD